MTQTRSFIGVVWLAFGWLVFAHPPTAVGEQQETQEESASAAYELGPTLGPTASYVKLDST